jgi:uncharacterized protein
VTLAAALLALFLGAPMLVVALFGRSFLYHPTRDDAARLARGGWQVARLERPEGVALVGLVRPGPADQPWLLFFSGNASGLAGSRDILEACAGGAAWGLAAFAYRGYDGSGGSPAQKDLLADAEAIATWLEATHGVAPSRLVLVGQSLGSGVAAHVSAVLARAGRPPRSTVLVSPYTSMARVFDEQVPLVPIGWVAPDPYRTDRFVDDLPGPLLLLHGGADTLIAPQHSRDLAARLGSRARHVELAELAHNDMWDDERVLAAIRGAVELPP